MVDFKKKLSKPEIEKKTTPLDIYNSLDRRSVTGSLRPCQIAILENWYSSQSSKRDLVIKLHTGEGKTLIGLLILQSKLNSTGKPCLYVCPNKYLVQQVCQEANKFGIPYCEIEETNELPNDFLEGNKILITHIQKVFNGKSIFGINKQSIETECVVIDDSHACIDAIRDSFSIKLQRSHKLYNVLFELFEDDLRNQGEGSFFDIQNGVSNTLLLIPYWAWIDKKTDVLRNISQYKDDREILFSWPILKDIIEQCNAHITGTELEITPTHIPIHFFGTFSNAKQRILMSATTQDDSFFIKGLGFSIDSVQNPLLYSEQKWSGEKMVLLPSLIDEEIDREEIVRRFALPFSKTYGIVAIVSSFRKAELYEQKGAEITKSESIYRGIQKLKDGEFNKTVVIVNRYDGIDLPDEACRILIIDSMPYFNSLADRYEELCRSSSDIINIKIAQKIEQGLGRSVRGEKDYTVILLIGPDLLRFVKSIRTNKYFSEQTKKQIQIGLEISELAKEDLDKSRDSFTVVRSLINQSLNRDEGWKEFYREEMNKISASSSRKTIYSILQVEKEAEDLSNLGDYDAACQKIQYLIDNYIEDQSEKGWYLQIMARYKYWRSKTDSNTIQKSAFKSNLQVLKPKDGLSYKKVEYIHENRIRRIKAWIEKHESYDELCLSVENLLENLSFGIEAEKFENALWEIGNLLGFISQRPDKEFRRGPDNLWCGVDNKYFIFECKSEVESSRDEIHKHEADQMNSHAGWFETEYGSAPVSRILIIPTRRLSYYAILTHEIRIIRKKSLNKFKNNIKSFIKEFMAYKLSDISDEKIQEFINTHKLNIFEIEVEYSESKYNP